MSVKYLSLFPEIRTPFIKAKFASPMVISIEGFHCILKSFCCPKTQMRALLITSSRESGTYVFDPCGWNHVHSIFADQDGGAVAVEESHLYGNKVCSSN